MTEYEKLNELKKFIDDGIVSDEQALSYLANAEMAILETVYPYGNGEEELPRRYEREQISIAVYNINKRGAEGETSHSEGGVVRAYRDTDIPVDIYRRLVPKCGVIGG